MSEAENASRLPVWTLATTVIMADGGPKFTVCSLEAGKRPHEKLDLLFGPGNSAPRRACERRLRRLLAMGRRKPMKNKDSFL